MVPTMMPPIAAQALAEMIEELLAHAAGDDNRLSHLVRALDIVQWMYRERVRLAAIPEPTDMDPVEMALAASVVEGLVGVYTTPPHCQHQRAPEWCATVPPSPTTIWLVPPQFAAEEPLNEKFHRRNIKVLETFLFFV